MGICRWRLVIVSTRDQTASYKALSHTASATLTATNTLAVSSKRMQKACYEMLHMTNVITLRIANIKPLARVSAMRLQYTAMVSNFSRAMCCAQHSSTARRNGSKHSAAKPTMQHIVHCQPNAQPNTHTNPIQPYNSYACCQFLHQIHTPSVHPLNVGQGTLSISRPRL